MLTKNELPDDIGGPQPSLLLRSRQPCIDEPLAHNINMSSVLSISLLALGTAATAHIIPRNAQDIDDPTLHRLTPN